jgi:hypothetical protein
MKMENIAPPTGDSFLLTDIGHSTVTATLFDIVGDSYRLVGRGQAPATLGDPWREVSAGVRRAIRSLSTRTQRPLLDERGWLIMPQSLEGMGVDRFGSTISTGEPLRVFLVCLLDDFSLASARRALAMVYGEEVDCLSLTDERSEAQQIGALLAARPDVIFVVGGTDSGDSQRVMARVETVAIALALAGREEVRRPHVIFAGNRQLQAIIQENLAELAMLHLVDNVRPSLEVENLGPATEVLETLYEDLKASTLHGLDDVAAWCQDPMMPTSRALATIARFLAARDDSPVFLVDIGSRSISLAAASPRALQAVVSPTYGLGRPMGNALKRLVAKDVVAWLPAGSVDETSAAAFAMNRSLRPQAIPATDESLRLEQAFAREMLRATAEHAAALWNWPESRVPSFERLVLRGGMLTGTPRPGQAVLMALDALQPTGVFSVSVDRYGALPALGALAHMEPIAAVQALGSSVLVNLGWVIALTGRGQPGQTALELKLESANGTLEVEVPFGSLEVLPLAVGEKARLSVRPTSRHFDIGYGPGQKHTVPVEGGLVGLVVDARGRPLPVARESDLRREQMQKWLWDMGG